jgi:16S rRNA A1518/A1519 N6-dimethyltransferase RsmA/KsgA/DIM1 with predicted DNA glycosylase/AP lyase activity
VNRRRLLGQHFLRSEAVARALVWPLRDAGPHEIVAEIGTGRGFLTRRILSGSSSLLVSVELDEDLCRRTADEIGGSWNLGLVCGDAYSTIRRFDYLISSPPYYESSNILRWLAAKDFKLASLILQEEFVSKLIEEPGKRGYGAISAFAQLAFRMSAGPVVPPGSFSPMPEVNSRTLILRPRVAMSDREARWILSQLRRLFSYRKKRLSRVCRDLGLEIGCGTGRVSELGPREALGIAAAIPTG